MKYAVEMSSGALIYIPSFIHIGSGIQKLMEGKTQTHRQHGDLISLLLFFLNKESRLRIDNVMFKMSIIVGTYLFVVYLMTLSVIQTI
jgi:hypothetical protein